MRTPVFLAAGGNRSLVGGLIAVMRAFLAPERVTEVGSVEGTAPLTTSVGLDLSAFEQMKVDCNLYAGLEPLFVKLTQGLQQRVAEGRCWRLISQPAITSPGMEVLLHGRLSHTGELPGRDQRVVLPAAVLLAFVPPYCLEPLLCSCERAKINMPCISRWESEPCESPKIMCAEGLTCSSEAGGKRFCRAHCTSTAQCRPDFECLPAGQPGTQQVCRPGPAGVAMTSSLSHAACDMTSTVCRQCTEIAGISFSCHVHFPWIRLEALHLQAGTLCPLQLLLQAVVSQAPWPAHNSLLPRSRRRHPPHRPALHRNRRLLLQHPRLALRSPAQTQVASARWGPATIHHHTGQVLCCAAMSKGVGLALSVILSELFYQSLVPGLPWVEQCRASVLFPKLFATYCWCSLPEVARLLPPGAVPTSSSAARAAAVCRSAQKAPCGTRSATHATMQTWLIVGAVHCKASSHWQCWVGMGAPGISSSASPVFMFDWPLTGDPCAVGYTWLACIKPLTSSKLELRPWPTYRVNSEYWKSIILHDYWKFSCMLLCKLSLHAGQICIYIY
jgi:hypothetical protein